MQLCTPIRSCLKERRAKDTGHRVHLRTHVQEWLAVYHGPRPQPWPRVGVLRQALVLDIQQVLGGLADFM